MFKENRLAYLATSKSKAGSIKTSKNSSGKKTYSVTTSTGGTRTFTDKSKAQTASNNAKANAASAAKTGSSSSNTSTTSKSGSVISPEANRLRQEISTAWADEGKSYTREQVDKEVNKRLKGKEEEYIEENIKTKDLNKAYQDALKQMEADPAFQALPENIKSLFRETLKNFDFSQDVNIKNILKSFNNIKENTIDPRFAKEVGMFTEQVKRDYEASARDRALELEAEGLSAEQAIRQVQQDLEASGMTFTGRGVEQLGGRSTYATQQGQSQIPLQSAFQGAFMEGRVPQTNRLLATSSAERYRQNLEKLGRGAEQVLGGNLGNLIPGYKASGSLPGTLEDARQGMYSQTLSYLAQQQRAKNAYNQPLEYNFPDWSSYY